MKGGYNEEVLNRINEFLKDKQKEYFKKYYKKNLSRDKNVKNNDSK